MSGFFRYIYLRYLADVRGTALVRLVDLVGGNGKEFGKGRSG